MKKDRYLYIILAIAFIALLINLNSWSVIEASEARYAEISREMFRSGDLFQPTLLNIYHYHKPPFTFWLTGLGFQLFGVNLPIWLAQTSNDLLRRSSAFIWH